MSGFIVFFVSFKKSCIIEKFKFKIENNFVTIFFKLLEMLNLCYFLIFLLLIFNKFIIILACANFNLTFSNKIKTIADMNSIHSIFFLKKILWQNANFFSIFI